MKNLTPSNTTITLEEIRAALSFYSAGEKTKALDVLRPYYRPVHHGHHSPSVPQAVSDWIALACDRLRKELGEDVIALSSVQMCLNTAIGLLEK